ncbi:hypothetical protein BBO99_00006444 [Phytophthora kernoviae]|uniref:Uncharacterized protein n=2 Tax=Phytophthora kernoviae TaxID=325452 RepID=A0A3R7MRP7_9STRA|nr:hypothetical protein G195_010152 [Phytophthora kernoviae 00238/432]KAG2511039.1 hypothetical protein JM16_008269 [Phytophthora kernoviae]KAG2514659.1 hypothetical protein JM18_007947 [Phytophthora kernoviae]RLN26773.1 hypothetical protein BBI17_006508 [Phytophthora kernoviae]RLN77838.1 hypothetical protein BBO99_00006444 [Phytophthora kernoviae]
MRRIIVSLNTLTSTYIAKGCHIAMSSQRGNVKKRAPKHQNTFAFKHNPKSKKTERILSMPIHGLCDKCLKQIEWRKKYRKYKPLSQPGSCIYCHQKTVTSAYHSACNPCAKERDVCAKCCVSKEIVASKEELAAEHERKAQEFESTLEGMRERDRRAYLRKLEKERESIANGEGAGSTEANGGYESFDEEEDERMQ